MVVTPVAAFAAEAAPLAAARPGWWVLGAPRAWEMGCWGSGTAPPPAWLQRESRRWGGSALA